MRNRHNFLLFIFLFLTIATDLSAQILAERDRAKVVDDLLEERFETVLPGLMDQSGFDMWILISREYNLDTVLRNMLPETWLNDR